MNPLDQQLSSLLERAHLKVAAMLDTALAQEGVKAEQLQVLQVLADEAGHAMGDIAECVEMNPPTLTKLIDKMVGQSLVQRAADMQDSRRVLVYATDAGLALLERVQPRADKHHQSLVEVLGEKDAKQLARLLMALVQASPANANSANSKAGKSPMSLKTTLAPASRKARAALSPADAGQ
jgi:MarR family transcriptional regulator, organic hydroperoxide resistance regulator